MNEKIGLSDELYELIFEVTDKGCRIDDVRDLANEEIKQAYEKGKSDCIMLIDNYLLLGSIRNKDSLTIRKELVEKIENYG